MLVGAVRLVQRQSSSLGRASSATLRPVPGGHKACQHNAGTACPGALAHGLAAQHDPGCSRRPERRGRKNHLEGTLGVRDIVSAAAAWPLACLSGRGVGGWLRGAPRDPAPHLRVCSRHHRLAPGMQESSQGPRAQGTPVWAGAIHESGCAIAARRRPTGGCLAPGTHQHRMAHVSGASWLAHPGHSDSTSPAEVATAAVAVNNAALKAQQGSGGAWAVIGEGSASHACCKLQRGPQQHLQLPKLQTCQALRACKGPAPCEEWPPHLPSTTDFAAASRTGGTRRA